MSQFSNACLIAGLAIAGGAAAQTAPNDDPHAWLEDVQGEKALDWVKARNACGGAPPWPSTARPIPSGKPCSTSTR